MANFAAEYAETNASPLIPPVEEIEMMSPVALGT